MIVFAGLSVFLTLIPIFFFWRWLTSWMIAQGGETEEWGKAMGWIF